MAKTDWEAARGMYMTTNCTQREIAEKYHVSESAVARRAKKEDWTGLRQNHARKTAEQFAKKSAEKNAKKLLQLSAAAETLSKVVNKKAKAILLAAKNAEKGEDKTLKNVDAHEVLFLAKSATELTGLMRDLFSIPKAEPEKDTTITVTMDGVPPEYTR